MDPISAVSAILAIATSFQHTYNRLRRCYKNLKHARGEIQGIARETMIFADLLLEFHETVTDVSLSNAGLSKKIQRSKICKYIVEAGERDLEKINNILYKVKPLRADKGYPQLEQWAARWNWHRCKEEWPKIQQSLTSIKESATMLMTMISVQDLVQRLGVSKAESADVQKTLLGKLNRCKTKMKTLRAQFREKQKECERLKVSRGEYDVIQINMKICRESQRLVQSHIEEHEEIRAILRGDTPPSSFGSGLSSFRGSGRGTAPASLPSSNSSPPPTNVEGESRHSSWSLPDGGSREGLEEEIVEECREPVVEERSEEKPEGFEEQAIEGRGEQVVDEHPEEHAEVREEGFIEHHSHTLSESEDPLEEEHVIFMASSSNVSSASVEERAPSEHPVESGVLEIAPPTGVCSPDFSTRRQYIITDRNDGRGPRTEFRRPRRPQAPPASSD